MFIKELAALGLSSGEAKVYEYLIQKGDGSAAEIAKETTLGRTNVYEYADLLEKRNLVSSYEKKRKIYFHAESPTELTQLVEKQTTVAKQNEAILAEILPKLLLKYDNVGGIPIMTHLQGDSGYRDFCDSIYLKGGSEEIYFFLKTLDTFEPPEPRYRNKIQERNLHTFLFACKGEGVNEFQKRDAKENRTTIIKDLALEIDIAVYEDRIYLGNFSNQNFVASVIQNYAFANFIRALLTASL